MARVQADRAQCLQDANEKLGDINELILDKDGKISAVVIGVGGFLGMGEHDIAVPMDKLKFKEEAVCTSATATTTTTRESTTGAATTSAPTATATAPARTTAANADANDWTPDHAVMSATKDQLKAPAAVQVLRLQLNWQVRDPECVEPRSFEERGSCACVAFIMFSHRVLHDE